MSSLKDILYKAGFRGHALNMAYAIVMEESGGRANAKNSVGNSAGVGRGIFQINSYYHSEVSDAEAFDPLRAAKAAFRISHGGRNWSAWSTYDNGSYKKFYGGSQGAQGSGGGGGGGSYSGSTSTANLSKGAMAARSGMPSQ